MRLKKTTAALLVAGLTVAGSSYAWANEVIFKPVEEQTEIDAELATSVEIEPGVTLDPTESVANTASTIDSAVEETTEDTSITSETNSETSVTVEEDANVENKTTAEVSAESEFPAIPEGYTAGNLVALKQAYENAGSENAKQAILKNAHKAIAKFEAKTGSKQSDVNAEIIVDLELIGEIKPGETTIEPVQNETDAQPTVISTETTVKTEQHISIKAQQKDDKKALKEQQKADKKASQE